MSRAVLQRILRSKSYKSFELKLLACGLNFDFLYGFWPNIYLEPGIENFLHQYLQFHKHGKKLTSDVCKLLLTASIMYKISTNFMENVFLFDTPMTLQRFENSMPFDVVIDAAKRMALLVCIPFGKKLDMVKIPLLQHLTPVSGLNPRALATMGLVPFLWKGICQFEGHKQHLCNRQLIGTRYCNKGFEAYMETPLNSSFQNARDSEGHGTHTLSTAAGSFNPSASVFGVRNGTSKGGSPRGPLCRLQGAFDVAIDDGVDVLSVSLGGGTDDYFNDGIAIASFHAVRRGVSVVASAGNCGPDITAPGVDIIASYTEATSPTELDFDHRRTAFTVMSGTSMSCPHVSGVVGLLKTLYPNWSPAAIRSAVMTTARTRDNTGKPLSDSSHEKATPFAYGSGHIRPNRAQDPGLVYDLTVNDYLDFLCGLGYDQYQLAQFTSSHYECPTDYSVLDFNNPSITVPTVNGSVTVARKVKNVGQPGKYTTRIRHPPGFRVSVGQPGKYTTRIRHPPGFRVSVEPNVLEFKKIGEEKVFRVTIKANRGVKSGYSFGELLWSDGRHYNEDDTCEANEVDTHRHGFPPLLSQLSQHLSFTTPTVCCYLFSSDRVSSFITARLNSAGFIRSQGLIGGKWTDAYDGKTIEVQNPATGEVITNVSCMGRRETNDAIASAHDAFLCEFLQAIPSAVLFLILLFGPLLFGLHYKKYVGVVLCIVKAGTHRTHSPENSLISCTLLKSLKGAYIHQKSEMKRRNNELHEKDRRPPPEKRGRGPKEEIPEKRAPPFKGKKERTSRGKTITTSSMTSRRMKHDQFATMMMLVSYGGGTGQALSSRGHGRGWSFFLWMSFPLNVSFELGVGRFSGARVTKAEPGIACGLNFDFLYGFLPNENFLSQYLQFHKHGKKLTSISEQKARDSMFYSYKRNINGFAALLEEEEAAEIAKYPKVVSVLEDKGRNCTQLNSLDFLGLEKDGFVSPYSIWEKAQYGIWPESKSFSDNEIGPIPSKWKGICQFEGHKQHLCNSVFGVGNGTSKGGSPRAQAAAYKVCWGDHCFDADIMKAFDVAIDDGVDVLSVSLRGAADDYFTDGIAIAAFHAVRRGVTVVPSAGNSGPSPGTVSNAAPWIITVGASTLDRKFDADLKLRNGRVFKSENKFYPLISAADAKAANATEVDAQLCKPDTLDMKKVRGKIVVCLRGENARVQKGVVAARADAVGMILCNDESSGEQIMSDPHFLPATHIGYEDGRTLFAHLISTKYPQGLITIPKVLLNTKPAPFMATFSSRGPNTITPEILKPDITAPGVDIIASYTEGTSPTELDFDHCRTAFTVMSGTSMSCPHVSGVVGLLKTLYPDWSPAAFRSAIMTTARTRDNTVKPLSDSSHENIRPNRAQDPGLVYDLTVNDYLDFLCGLGYSQAHLAQFTLSHYECPTDYSLLDFNNPSITVPKVNGSVTVARKVKNVGWPGKYTSRIRQPPGFRVSVEPKVLEFEKIGEKEFRVTIKANRGVKSGYSFGELLWSDGRHYVDVNGWLEAFAAHPQIDESPSKAHKSSTSAQFSSHVTFTFFLLASPFYFIFNVYVNSRIFL
ncbi:subtilase family protein [Striga asiatica]|uniref:Subtilase family protein n=1 Tax=Striga asiatica TaxID=4170 RepID=A0A5A7R5X5_STRAF|nr:subtilase family protein [Striga asiatica]